MMTVPPRSMDHILDVSSVSSREKVMELVNDLRCTVSYIMMGDATVSSQPAQSRNRSTWVIRGPKKGLVVMLEYEHEPHVQNEEESGIGTISIKVEAPDAEGSDDQREDAVSQEVWTRSSKTRASMDGCHARVKQESDSSVNYSRTCKKEPEGDERTQRIDHHDGTGFVSVDGSLADDFQLKRESLLVLDSNLSYRPPAKLNSATSTYNEKKNGDSLEARFGIKTYSKRTKLPGIVKQERNLTSCENAIICNDADVTKEQGMPSKKSYEVCKTYICLDTAIPKVVSQVEPDSRTETVTWEAGIQLTAGKPNKERIDLEGNQYVCHYCEQKFDNWKQFSEHKEIHMDKPFKCSQCPKSFILLSQLERHETKPHVAKKPRHSNLQSATSKAEIKLTSRRPNNESVHLPGVRYQCFCCEMKFYDLEKLTEHEGVHTGKPLKCPQCPKSFVLLSHLKRHEELHTAKRPRQCLDCNKSFTTLGGLKRHENIHAGKREYECSQCDKSYFLPNDLRRHALTHGDEKPFSCSMCQRKFASAKSMKKHKKTHAGATQCVGTARMFQCPYCGKMFKGLQGCLNHERIHTGEYPYKCSYCDRSYMNSTSLKSHERVHTGERPYRCSRCSKSFPTVPTLRRHEVGHSGERRYQCKYCKKRFLRSETLREHERIHTGEKPYRCSQCYQRFRCAPQLSVHSKTHLPKHPATLLPTVET